MKQAARVIGISFSLLRLIFLLTYLLTYLLTTDEFLVDEYVWQFNGKHTCELKIVLDG